MTTKKLKEEQPVAGQAAPAPSGATPGTAPKPSTDLSIADLKRVVSKIKELYEA